MNNLMKPQLIGQKRFNMDETQIKLLVKRIASQCISSSALRNQGSPNVVRQARIYFYDIDITEISSYPNTFEDWINIRTNELIDFLPEGAKNYGTSRKAINLFLRDCLYNKIINQRYKLYRIETRLEIPIDSHVVNGMMQTKIGKKLPPWKSIKELTPEINAIYQKCAKDISKITGCRRVDVDIYLWRQIGIEELLSFGV